MRLAKVKNMLITSMWQVLVRRQALLGTAAWSLARQAVLKGNLPISQKLKRTFLEPRKPHLGIILK